MTFREAVNLLLSRIFNKKVPIAEETMTLILIGFSLFIILLGIMAGYFITKGNKFGTLIRDLGRGGKLTLALTLLVGVLSLVGFERLFLYFHLFSFSNDLWFLDPTRDYLLMMFPEAFFFDATIYIAIATVIESSILTIMPRILRIFWNV